MRKIVGIAAVAATVAATVIVGGGAAQAAPTHTTEMFVCDGEEVSINTAGRNGWIDGVKYRALSFTVEGTFTPTGGEPESFLDEKDWGGEASGETITCTSHFEETDEEGTAEGDITVIIELAG